MHNYRVSRHRRVAAGIAAILALASPSAFAATLPVTNCNDSGSGSLRGVVTGATSGDTIDLTGLTPSSPGCSASTVSLSTGGIVVAQHSLTINGPGSDLLAVSGKYNTGSGTKIEKGRIFKHTGTGNLYMNGLSLFYGYNSQDTKAAYGGCVYSAGNVYLTDVTVSFCRATSNSLQVKGGGIHVKGNLGLSRSRVTNNSVRTSDSDIYYALGGGISALGNFVAYYSTISGNSAYGRGYGGGIFATGANDYLLGTVVSGNQSDVAYGGAGIFAAQSVTIINSTIASNAAYISNAGLSIASDLTEIYNSTIAFNNSTQFNFATGLAVYGNAGHSYEVRLNSVLSSNNMNSDGSDDFPSYALVKGSNNLIYSSKSQYLPADTIIGKCPLLKKLSKNGGPTMTVGLHSRSPAIDAGNNVMVPPRDFDQRGSPYMRVSGAAPDIGAFEVQQDDVIFDAGFDGC
jgi:hypothetical protein